MSSPYTYAYYEECPLAGCWTLGYHTMTWPLRMFYACLRTSALNIDYVCAPLSSFVYVHRCQCMMYFIACGYILWLKCSWGVHVVFTCVCAEGSSWGVHVVITYVWLKCSWCVYMRVQCTCSFSWLIWGPSQQRRQTWRPAGSSGRAPDWVSQYFIKDINNIAWDLYAYNYYID